MIIINRRNSILREETRFPDSIYYIAMLLDLIFRISWAVSLFPTAFGITGDMHYVSLPLGCVEVIRRCIWNVFRLENEHINNCGEFRIVKDVPLFDVNTI